MSPSPNSRYSYTIHEKKSADGERLRIWATFDHADDCPARPVENLGGSYGHYPDYEKCTCGARDAARREMERRRARTT